MEITEHNIEIINLSDSISEKLETDMAKRKKNPINFGWKMWISGNKKWKVSLCLSTSWEQSWKISSWHRHHFAMSSSICWKDYQTDIIYTFFSFSFQFSVIFKFYSSFWGFIFQWNRKKKKHSVSKCLKGDFGWFLLSLMMKMMMILWDTGVKGSFSERDFAVCRFEIK